MSDDGLGELYRRAVVRARAGDGEGCPSPDALRSVAERTGGEVKRLTLMEHVAGCSDCQRELALLGQVAGTRPAARRTLVPRVPVRWLAAAAAIVLAVVGGRALATRGPVAPVMRGDQPAVTLLAPAGSTQATPAPVFVWSSVERATRYEVEVLGPDAELVASAMVRDTVMAAPDDLEPGIRYRWRVTALRADGTRVESTLVGFELIRE
jgi:hypothetical protein